MSLEAFMVWPKVPSVVSRKAVPLLAVALMAPAFGAACAPGEPDDGSTNEAEDPALASVNGLNSLNGLSSLNGLNSLNGLTRSTGSPRSAACPRRSD